MAEENLTSVLTVIRDFASTPARGEVMSITGSRGVKLVAATDAPLAVPADTRIVIITYSAHATVFVTFDAAAVLPPGPPFTLALPSQRINPRVLAVKPESTLHFISDGTPFVNVEFFKS